MCHSAKLPGMLEEPAPHSCCLLAACTQPAPESPETHQQLTSPNEATSFRTGLAPGPPRRLCRAGAACCVCAAVWDASLHFKLGEIQKPVRQNGQA